MSPGNSVLAAMQKVFSPMPPLYTILATHAKSLGLYPNKLSPCLDQYRTDGDRVALTRNFFNPYGHHLDVKTLGEITLWRNPKTGSWVAQHRNEWGSTWTDQGPWPLYAICRCLADVYQVGVAPPVTDLAMEEFLRRVDPVLGDQWRLLGWSDRLFRQIPTEIQALIDALKEEGDVPTVQRVIDVMQTVSLLEKTPKRTFMGIVQALEGLALQDSRQEVANDAVTALSQIGSQHESSSRGLHANTVLGRIAGGEGTTTRPEVAQLANRWLIHQLAHSF